jgi:hypothetical protein
MDVQLSWVSVGLACVGAVLMPMVPVSVFLGLIVLSVLCTGVGLVVGQRRWRREALEADMEAAFGIRR